MPAPKVRADYDSLTRVAQVFGQTAASTRQMLQRIKQQVGVLQGGDWIGRGATAFYQEMNGDVLPTLTRLTNALDAAQRITNQINQLMQAAEREAANQFRADGSPGAAGAASGAAGGAGGAGGDAGADGAAGGSAGAGGAEQVPDWQQQNPLLARDPKSLFSDGYMSTLVGSKFQGADSEALEGAMKDLAKNPTGADLDRTLARIAELRGRPVGEIQAEYQKYLQIRQQAGRIGAANNQETPPDLSRIHWDFMGSTTQLRYGKVVGDAFGIDPVFGSLLNPTGGLVGPGNASFDADGTPVGYHGIVHDAAGYLHNYHNAGPGYDYLGREDRDTSSPLSGQREGIAYWRDKVGGTNPGSFTSEWIMRGVVPVADAYNWTADKFSKIKNLF